MNDWTWNKLVTSKCWHELILTGYPGWDKRPDGEVHYRELVIQFGNPPSSHTIADWFDDICRWQFYYRDFTDSGIQIVDEGEYYRGVFYFQSEQDCQVFNQRLNELYE